MSVDCSCDFREREPVIDPKCPHHNREAPLDKRTQEALDRLIAVFEAEKMRFRGPEGDEHPVNVPEMPTLDLLLVFTDDEARRRLKHHLGIQESKGFV